MTKFSGITPSGHVQLGNHLGAIRRWAAESAPEDLYFVSDLHAMTTTHNPARLRSLAGEHLAVLVAAGIAPEQIFVQSDIAKELGALTWILECTCSYGEAARMIQFKEKSMGQTGVRLSLLTYPVLMAADILLQGASEVPVGEDQRQHVELARALARRFNGTYGEVFTVPAYEPEARPGLGNLLEILAACTGGEPSELATEHKTYGSLKEATAEAVVETLRPLREGAGALLEDPAELDRVRKAGAARAVERGEHRLQSALRLVGAG